MVGQRIDEIKCDVLDTRCWIKKIIASVESDEQLDCAQKLVRNWGNLMFRRIDQAKPSLFRSGKEWKELIEFYTRTHKELESHLAVKKAKLRFIKRDEMHA